MRVEIEGSVQGVGFRPFVYRLARELELTGWVLNDTRGVTVEIEGGPAELERFLVAVERDAPRAASIETLRHHRLDPTGRDRDFRIRSSPDGGTRTTPILPDLATCPECIEDVLAPANRRHGYPFTNCTQCGPRFSIVRALPYDRPHTTMSGFEMCPDCLREYEHPEDRRFHAQPNACPVCGPRVALLDADGSSRATGGDAVRRAASAIRGGRVVAVKGLGGFHLMVDAADAGAVRRLREAKPRRAKPFAVMVADLETARRLCRVDRVAAERLRSPEAPIVLLRKLDGAAIDEAVAPDNPNLGLMLPYTPLHHLLMTAVARPVVATSGNLSDEPICTDEGEAVERLAGIAELFLIHDRPIARHVDDSVVSIVDGHARLLRRARGYAPRPVLVRRPLPAILGVGGHLKNAVALGIGPRVFLSQHIGDMDTPESRRAFERVIDDFLRLYETRPVAVAHDLHPDYATTRWTLDATSSGPLAEPRPRVVPVQHHHAHLAGCLADNDETGPALGAIWDGTGYGTDGTVWGGEFLVGDAGGFERFATLRPFGLPGGELAVREPRRAALALLWELDGQRSIDSEELAPVADFRAAERRAIARLLTSGVHCPRTTSLGRLFDGVASIVGLCQRNAYEGQAAMTLEYASDGETGAAYPFSIDAGERETGPDSPRWVVDWRPMLAALLDDRARGVPVAEIAARFHETWVEVLVEIARRAGQPAVALSGGCWQNRRLVERALARLRETGFRPLIHRRVPPNDGGISLGQVHVAAARLATA
jgi:hydrogenase maturation protein HypF